MNTWTKQMGHPVVKINFLNSTHISISQNHFLLDKSIPEKSEYKYNKLTNILGHYYM